MNRNGKFAFIAIAAVSCSAYSAPPRAVDVECEPALPVFCQNIHVSCAGPTELRTFAFRLRVVSGKGWIEAEPGAAEFQLLYSDARIEWSEAQGDVILRPREGPGYIKLQADGRFSFRHYPQSIGIMAYGRCQ